MGDTGFNADQIAFVGDDIIDIGVMKQVALSIGRLMLISSFDDVVRVRVILNNKAEG